MIEAGSKQSHTSKNADDRHGYDRRSFESEAHEKKMSMGAMGIMKASMSNRIPPLKAHKATKSKRIPLLKAQKATKGQNESPNPGGNLQGANLNVPHEEFLLNMDHTHPSGNFQGPKLNVAQEALVRNTDYDHPGANLQGANLNVPQEEMLLNMQKFSPRGCEQNPWV